MEVNNKSEISKMFGSADSPATESADDKPTPELQASPVKESAPTGTPENSSPFQKEGGGGDDTKTDKPSIPDSVADVTNPLGTNSFTSEISYTIGDHDGFSSLLHDGRKKVGLRLMLIAIPLTLLIGTVAGAFACYIYFFGLNLSSEDSAARTAIESVREFAIASEENTPNVIFTSIYVNNKTNQFDCIVFAVIKNSPIDHYSTVFRVTIDKNTDEVVVFSLPDEAEITALRASDDTNDHIQAEILRDRHETFMRILGEIENNSRIWKSIDPFYLNVIIK
jgi:hypothetical protein